MSGPLPTGGAHGVGSMPHTPLTPTQWQALARLADRIMVLEEAGKGPLGQAASDWVLKAAAVVQGQDGKTLGQDVSRALEALSDAGLWAAIADNARTLKNTLDGVPFDAAAIQKAVVSAEGLGRDVQVLRGFAARLHALEELLAGPVGQELSEAWVTATTATEGLDLATLGQELAQTLKALSESGSLRFLADNLPSLAASLRHISATSPELVAALGPLVDTVREDLTLAHKLAAWIRHTEAFLAGPAGQAAVGAWVAASQKFTDQDLGGLAGDIVELLLAWRRIGLFPVLRDVGGGLVTLTEVWRAAGGGAALQETVGRIAAPSENGPGWQRIGALWAAMRTASADQPPSEGGVKGLYKLLTDPVVQDGARQAAMILRLVSVSLAPRHEAADPNKGA